MKKKITIECTEKQALLIEIALDAVCRMTCGQLTEGVRAIESYRGKCFPLEKIETYNALLLVLKMTLFPELHENASYGVGMKEIGDAQIAYEMVKKLQNYRSINYKNKHSVLHHEPLHYSDEPLIKIKEKK